MIEDTFTKKREDGVYEWVKIFASVGWKMERVNFFLFFQIIKDVDVIFTFR